MDRLHCVRPILLAAAFGLAAATHSQDLSARVSYTAPAAPAKRVLEELSKLSGVTLLTAPQTENEMLVVSVDKVELGVLMRHIGTATSGEWKQEGEGFRLVANAGLRNTEARNEQLAHANKIRKAVDEQFKKKPAAPAAGEGEAPAAAQGMGGFFGGGDKVFAKIVPFLDANVLASVNKGDRIVFATSPNRMQRQLGLNMGPIVQELIQEKNKAAAAAKQPDEKELEELAKLPEFIRNMAERFRPKPVVGEPAKVLLIATRQPFFDALQLQLKVFDQQGVVMVTESTMLNVGSGFMGMGFDPAELANPKPPPKTDEPAIEFSPITQEMHLFFRNGMNPAALTSTKLSERVMERLRRPDLHDPLSFVPSELMLAVAKAKGQPLVANLPDSMISWVGMMMGGEKQTVSKVMQDIKSGESLTLATPDGWIVLKPAQPHAARLERIDRGALAALIKASTDKGVPSLDDIAAYSLRAPSPMESGISIMYLSMLAPGALNMSWSGMTDWNMLRFYGSLTANQKQAVRDGGRIEFARMTPDQQALASRLLFGASARLVVAQENAKKDDFEFPGMEFMEMFMGGSGSDYRTEPTEVMPTGLPSNGYLDVAVSRENFAKPAAEAGSGMMMMGAMGADELAMLRLFKEDPNTQMMAAMMPNLDKLQIGDRLAMTFRFMVAPQTSVVHRLNDNSLAPNAAVVSANNLPDAFAKRVSERMEAIKKSPFGSMIGMMGQMGQGGVRPPAP